MAARRPPGGLRRLWHRRRVAFVTTGVGLLGHFGWWPGAAVVAGLTGAALMVLWFNAWLTVGLAISIAVLVAGVRGFTSS